MACPVCIAAVYGGKSLLTLLATTIDKWCVGTGSLGSRAQWGVYHAGTRSR